MDEVRMNFLDFLLISMKLGWKNANIRTAPDFAEAGETNVKSVERFLELYEELGQMMKEYQSLMEKDQRNLLEIENTLMEQDLSLEKLWNQ